MGALRPPKERIHMIKKGIIFDLDGTLWDTSEKVMPAWNIVLKRYPELNKQITQEEMNSFFGKTIDEIAKMMLPDTEEQKRLDIMKECCREEQEYLSKYGGVLYPGLEKTLQELNKKYSLYIVSNCQDGYLQTFLNFHKLNSYFADFEMSGRTGMKKAENIKEIIKRNALDKAIYIGDTTDDRSAAEGAGIPFVFADYGFGTVNDTKYSISKIGDLVVTADDAMNERVD